MAGSSFSRWYGWCVAQGSLFSAVLSLAFLVTVPSAEISHSVDKVEGSLFQLDGTEPQSLFPPAPTYSMAFTDPRPPRILEVSPHQSINLVCEAAAVDGPAPVIHWLKNGVPLGNISEVHEDITHGKPTNVITSTTRSVLYLDCITVRSEGTYTCVAENIFSKVQTRTQIVVLPGRANRVFAIALGKECSARSTPVLAMPPRIYTWSKNTLQAEGLSARLLCRCAGYPKPETYWELHYAQPGTVAGVRRIENNGLKYKIMTSGDLVVFDLQFHSDMGYYICQAGNAIGTERIERTLYTKI